jgi:hypothetical protein
MARHVPHRASEMYGKPLTFTGTQLKFSTGFELLITSVN